MVPSVVAAESLPCGAATAKWQTGGGIALSRPLEGVNDTSEMFEKTTG
jgi:hypothetical protein